MITQTELKSLLHYDELTGIFTWLVRPTNSVSVGDIAGTINKFGYIQININKKQYKAHRLAWLYMTGELPTDMIDHINGVRNDNKFNNLREATRSENQRNRGKPSDNTSGFKGVSVSHYLKDGTPRFSAYCNNRDGKITYLGIYQTPELASEAYKDFAKANHGEFYRDPVTR